MRRKTINYEKRVEFRYIKHHANLIKECVNCGATGELHTHHIIPVGLGGTNRVTNLCVLCTTCHGLLHNLDFSAHSASIIESRKRMREQGKWATGPLPYGYTTNRDGYIEISPENAEVVRWIYHWRYDIKLTLRNIKEMLYELAVPTATGHNDVWSDSTIKELLENPIVFGGTYLSADFPPIVDERYRSLADQYKGVKFSRQYISLSSREVDETPKEASQS